MALPAFNENGDLPPGIHQTPLSDAVARLGTKSDRRKLLAQRLQRVYKLASGTGVLVRFVVFGSFVTAKEQPNDVDVFMIMDDNFDVTALVGESRLLFDHSAAQNHFGCSVFWVRRLAAIGGEQAAMKYWQIKRDGAERGILEITQE